MPLGTLVQTVLALEAHGSAIAPSRWERADRIWGGRGTRTSDERWRERKTRRTRTHHDQGPSELYSAMNALEIDDAALAFNR